MKLAPPAVLLAAAAVALAGCAAAHPVHRARPSTHQASKRPPNPLTKKVVACERSGKVICDPVAYGRDRREGLFPLSHPDPRHGHLLTRAQIVRQYGGKGVTVAALLLTYGAAQSLAPDLAGGSSAVVDPNRKVWLVTLYYDPPKREVRDWGFGPASNSGLPAKVRIQHDSFVIDAATNTKPDACQGCAVVPESNVNWPVAARPSVTRAQAAADFRRGLGTTKVRIQLVWAQEKVTDVDLEWMAYAPHARLKPISEPLGRGGHVKTYVGPALGWMSAMGGPPAGAGSVRPLRGHHLLPLRSRSIPVALVRQLGKRGFRVALTPVRVRPTIGRVRALETLHPQDPSRAARHIWLVDLFRRGTIRLTWLVARLDGSYAFVSATTGRVVAPRVTQ